MRHRSVLTLRCAALAALGLTGACTHGGSGSVHHAPPPGPEVLYEIEPNDSPYTPDLVGGVHDRAHLVIEGHVEGLGGFDRYDHFWIVADEPLWLDFSLRALGPYADLDLCLWDPDLEQIVACWDGPWDPELGSFTLDWTGKAVVLLVESFDLDSAYELELVAAPHPGFAPGDPHAGPDGLGPGGVSFPDGRPVPEKAAHRPAALPAPRPRAE